MHTRMFTAALFIKVKDRKLPVSSRGKVTTIPYIPAAEVEYEGELCILTGWTIPSHFKKRNTHIRVFGHRCLKVPGRSFGRLPVK